MDLFSGLCKSPCGEDNGVFFITHWQAAHADLPSLALAVKI